MATTMLILSIIAWATGGSAAVAEVRLVSVDANLSDAGKMEWATPVWEYVVPYTAALIVYFLASAALLGLRHPMRWILGVTFGLAILVAVVLKALPGSPLALGMETIRQSLWLGDYGLSHALTGGSDGLAHEFDLPSGGTQIVWVSLPTLSLWLRATAPWMMLSLLLLSIAIWRHAER
jgi:hypothetical protein